MIDTSETAPADATHWSTRGLAAKHGISHTTVGEIWRAFGLKPWRQDTFKLSPDPGLVEKIRDLVSSYMNPPVAAPVLAVDEKPQIQALNRTAPHRTGLADASASPTRSPTQHNWSAATSSKLYARPDLRSQQSGHASRTRKGVGLAMIGGFPLPIERARW